MNYIISTSTNVLTLVLLWGLSVLCLSAELDKGLDAVSKGDRQTALNEWLPLAENGDAAAQYNIGVMFDPDRYLRPSIENTKIALKWYTLAAEQGYSSAQQNLGLLYAKGQGVLRSYVRAFMWFSLAEITAIDVGMKKHSAESRDIAATFMNASEIEEAKKLTQECIKRQFKGC